MNKNLYALVMVLFLFSACKKDRPTDAFENPKGQWQWVRSTGSIAGGTYTPETEGYNLSLTLDGTNYYRYKDNILVKAGTYAIANKTSLITNKNEDFIVYDADTTTEQIISISPTTLYLTDDFPDGYSNEYTKSR